MDCKTCNKEMVLIKDTEYAKLYFCLDCELFLEVTDDLGFESFTWKNLSGNTPYRVTFWRGNGEYCHCHRVEKKDFEDFYSLEEANNFAVHFLADGEFKDGKEPFRTDRDRGVTSIYQVGVTDYYNEQEIKALAKIEVERRKTGKEPVVAERKTEEEILEEANPEYWHKGEGNALGGVATINS